MIRKIIEINEELCNGCGLCAHACHEGAIGIVDGKAKLLRDDYCDGFGDCLPACPMNAIRFIEREAPEYNEAEVLANKAASGNQINNWPVQIKLVSSFAPCFNGAAYPPKRKVLKPAYSLCTSLVSPVEFCADTPPNIAPKAMNNPIFLIPLFIILFFVLKFRNLNATCYFPPAECPDFRTFFLRLRE